MSASIIYDKNELDTVSSVANCLGIPVYLNNLIQEAKQGRNLNKLPTAVYRLITYDLGTDKSDSQKFLKYSNNNLINLLNTVNLKLSLHNCSKGANCRTDATGRNVKCRKLMLPEASFRLQVPTVI